MNLLSTWSAKAAGPRRMRAIAGRFGTLALGRAPWRSLGLAAVAGAVAAVPGSAHALLYDRDGVLSGELWRAISGHFVHAGSSHFFWDVAALLAIGVLWERVLGARYWTVFCAAASFLTVGLLLLAPGLSLYGGLSGVLCGLFVAGAMAAARLERSAVRGRPALLFHGAVIACLAKIGFEATTGSTIFANIASDGWVPVPLAHALGALGGVIGLAPLGWPRSRPQRGALRRLPRSFGQPSASFLTSPEIPRS